MQVSLAPLFKPTDTPLYRRKGFLRTMVFVTAQSSDAAAFWQKVCGIPVTITVPPGMYLMEWEHERETDLMQWMGDAPEDEDGDASASGTMPCHAMPCHAMPCMFTEQRHSL